MFEATPGKPDDTTRSGGPQRRFDRQAYQARCSAIANALIAATIEP
jgi:hypothetical protein